MRRRKFIAGAVAWPLAARAQTGVRESAQSWRKLLIDIKRRGLEIAPESTPDDRGERMRGRWGRRC